MSAEIYPNITWEAESQKLFTGDDFQKGSASMIRCVKAEMDLIEQSIKNGADPSMRLQQARHWLTVCLYSCNMENYKQPLVPPVTG